MDVHVASLVCLVVKTLAWPDLSVKLKHYLVSYVITTHTDTPELMEHTHLTGILLKCALYYRCGRLAWPLRESTSPLVHVHNTCEMQ